MSGMLLGAIACSDEGENVPTPQPAPVATSGTEEPAVVNGAYNIQRFEQDGVENPEMKEQHLDFSKTGKVVVHGRNYSYEGQWSYNEGKEYIEINIPGDAMQAMAVTSPTWMIGVSEPGMLILVSNDGGTVKKLELRERTRPDSNDDTTMR